jgi:putative acetyltransferase
LKIADVKIRDENQSDLKAITEVTKAAFETLSISGHTEQFIIKALRKAGALTISLVAEADGKVVGHMALSPVTISDGSRDWYGLGPISVVPELHKQGIGSLLMGEGLTRLRSMGAKGCVLVGDPGYYERFGFRSLPDLGVEGVPQQYVLALPFNESKAKGAVVFHEAFGAKA